MLIASASIFGAGNNNGIVPMMIVLWIAVMIASFALQRGKRRRQHEHAHQLAATHNLVHDLRPPPVPGVRFKLLPRGSRTNALQASDRPETLYGFLLEYRSGKTTVARIVAVAEINEVVPHLSFRRSNILSRFDGNDIEIGDVAFDDRWSVKCDDPAFVQWLLASTGLHDWLGQFEDSSAAPEFEANVRHVVVSVPGQDLARIPDVIQLARTFGDLIQPARRQTGPQPPRLPPETTPPETPRH